eukprot:343287-Pleurochrysis_carterae.AAC.1
MAAERAPPQGSDAGRRMGAPYHCTDCAVRTLCSRAPTGRRPITMLSDISIHNKSGSGHTISRAQGSLSGQCYLLIPCNFSLIRVTSIPFEVPCSVVQLSVRCMRKLPSAYQRASKGLSSVLKDNAASCSCREAPYPLGQYSSWHHCTPCESKLIARANEV